MDKIVIPTCCKRGANLVIVNITHGVWKAGSHDKVCYSGVSRDKYGASDAFPYSVYTWKAHSKFIKIRFYAKLAKCPESTVRFLVEEQVESMLALEFSELPKDKKRNRKKLDRRGLIL